MNEDGPAGPSCAGGLTLNPSGWLETASGVTRCPSPNHDARPDGTDPNLLIVHNISLPPGQFGGTAIRDFFLNQLDFDAHPWFEHIRGVRVSAHFLVHRDGRIIQFVATPLRAWHAGVSQFQGRERCNDFSIGIELEGTDTLAYTDAQYRRLAQLSRAITRRHAVRWACGHEHIAPTRKTDPGPAFDWARFGQEGGWPADSLPPTGCLRKPPAPRQTGQ